MSQQPNNVPNLFQSFTSSGANKNFAAMETPAYFSTVEVPTKLYIKAYLKHLYDSEVPAIKQDDIVGVKLIEILSKKRQDENYRSRKYPTTVTIGLTKHMFHMWGFSMTPTGIKSFNDYVETVLKEIMRNYISVQLANAKKFVVAVDLFREEYDIDDEHWDSEAIKKDYYRYRKRMDKPLLYKKKNV